MEAVNISILLNKQIPADLGKHDIIIPMSGLRTKAIAMGVHALICIGCSSEDIIPPPIIESLSPTSKV